MKYLVLLLAALSVAGRDVMAQAVTKNVVLEHFTNTYCPPCASRNPGLYANLAGQPTVYHVSYHPSAPYPSCTLYQHNMVDNDARTNFYSVYGSTPRIVLQGTSLPSNTQFYDPALFDNALGQLSSFNIVTNFEQLNSNTLRVTVTIYKVDESPLTSADIYGAIVEDTLDLVTNNGEPHHYDVFRKGIWGAGVTNIQLPTTVNTSISMMQDVAIHSDWDLNKLYAMVMLHNTDKTLIQAAKSGHPSASTGMSNTNTGNTVQLYPNPATTEVTISGLGQAGGSFSITDMTGREVLRGIASGTETTADISSLSAGLYLLTVRAKNSSYQLKLVKK